MGEGWGEGDKPDIPTTYIPLPLVPSRQGRGLRTFYKFIKKSSINFLYWQKHRKNRFRRNAEVVEYGRHAILRG